MRVVVDRIEDGVAVLQLENGKIVNAPVELFCECTEGDIVDITVNKPETIKRKTAVKIDVSKLFDN